MLGVTRPLSQSMLATLSVPRGTLLGGLFSSSLQVQAADSPRILWVLAVYMPKSWLLELSSEHGALVCATVTWLELCTFHGVPRVDIHQCVDLVSSGARKLPWWQFMWLTELMWQLLVMVHGVGPKAHVACTHTLCDVCV